MPNVDIPGVGVVAFPDSMGQDAINAQAKRLYDTAQAKASQPTPVSAQPNPVDQVRSGPGGIGGAILGGLPAAGGIIGGLGGGAVGGAFGMGLGLPEGVALGSGLGTAGGEALRESILRGMGYAAPETSGQAAGNILGAGASAAATGYGSAKALEIGGKALQSVGTHPAVQQAIRSLGARFMRLGGAGEVAEKAGEIAAKGAGAAEKEGATAAEQAATRTVKAGARAAKGKPLPGSAESRIKIVPKNKGQAGKSFPAMQRADAARLKLVGEAPAADDLSAMLKQQVEFESEMAHRGWNEAERAIARKLAARGISPEDIFKLQGGAQ